MMTVTSTTIRQTLKAGSYVSVNVSQTKDKGLAICRLTVADLKPVEISYFHQPFPHTEIVGEDVQAMVDRWPDELLSASCYSIDSPLAFAHGPDGRYVDRKSTWVQLGFGDYLNNEPQKAPTEVDGEEREEAMGSRWNVVARSLGAWSDRGLSDRRIQWS